MQTPVLGVKVGGCGEGERNLVVEGTQGGLTAQRLMHAVSHSIFSDAQDE